MSSFTYKQRLAATGAAGVMAVGTVAAVGAVTPAAASSSAPTRYVCKSGPPASLTVPASVVGTIKLPRTVKPGRSLAGIPMTMRVTLPDALIHQLQSTLGFTYLSGNVKNAALRLSKPGTTRKLPLGTLRIAKTNVPATGDMKLVAKGKTARTAKAPAKTGRYLVRMPKAFTFNPKSDAAIQTGPLACTLQGKAGNFGFMRVRR